MPMYPLGNISTVPLLGAFADVMQSIWQAFTSVYALVIYIVILVGLMIALVLSHLLGESKSAGTVVELPAELVRAPARHRGAQAEPEGGSGGPGRFYALARLDEERETYARTDYDERVTLGELCENFRNYAASRLGLYYDMADIRKFIAGLAVSKIMILQGISGTGKTSLGYALGEYLENPSTVVPVQPMWKERTDLLGYYNEFTRKYNETTLLQKLYEANYSKDLYVTLLDEMNIARIEYYFAEFLSLLELPNAEKRYLDVVTDRWESDPAQLRNGQIKLPENMWFIGTANNDDTTFTISDKVYDRAMVMNLDAKSEAFAAPWTEAVHLRAGRFEQLVRQAQREYAMTRRNVRRLEALDRYLIERYGITFGNRIRRQILTFVPVYLSCGGEELEALDDIVAKKVLRKLEMQNPVHMRNTGEEFCSLLDELFGERGMPQCKACVRRLAGNV